MANVLTTVDLSENHDAEVISIAVVFSLLSLASVIARIKSKKMKNNPIAIDDYLLVAAWVGLMIELMASTESGPR